MPLPQELKTIFQYKQASYKMVLIIALLKSIDGAGKAPLEEVADRFRAYYKKRASEGKLIEARDKAVYDVEKLSLERTKSLILGNPLQALNKVLERSTIEGKTYLGFKPEVWAILDQEKIKELKELAKDELKNYY